MTDQGWMLRYDGRAIVCTVEADGDWAVIKPEEPVTISSEGTFTFERQVTVEGRSREEA